MKKKTDIRTLLTIQLLKFVIYARATINIYTLIKYSPVFNYFITADARERIYRAICYRAGY